MSYYTSEELKEIGFKEFGSNVLISKHSSVYNAARISLGSNIRIDDFCILSAGEAGIEIGNNVHIACYVSLIGKAQIKIGNFVGISSKTAIYSSSDDYSGEFLTGPTVSNDFRNVDSRNVCFEDHVILGAQSVVLPGVTIGEGTAVGSLSLVSKSLESWKIYGGNPLRLLKERSKAMLKFVSISQQKWS